MWFVGLDVHGESTTACIRNSHGVIIRHEVVPTTRSGLRAIFKDLRGRVRVTCESGPLAGWVKHSISTRLREIVVCDARRNRLLSHGSKTDRIDAEKLSELLRLNAVHPVYVPKGEYVPLRRLAFHYARMVHDRTRVVQRIRSLFLEVGVRIPRGKNTRRNVSLRLLRDAAVRQIARAYLRQLDMAADLVATARRDLVTEAERSSVFELLQSIPYICEIRAAELMAVVGDPERFRSVRRFWAYGGLGVVRRVSAEHKFRTACLFVSNTPVDSGSREITSPALRRC